MALLVRGSNQVKALYYTLVKVPAVAYRLLHTNMGCDREEPGGRGWRFPETPKPRPLGTGDAVGGGGGGCGCEETCWEQTSQPWSKVCGEEAAGGACT